MMMTDLFSALKLENIRKLTLLSSSELEITYLEAVIEILVQGLGQQHFNRGRSNLTFIRE